MITIREPEVKPLIIIIAIIMGHKAETMITKDKGVNQYLGIIGSTTIGTKITDIMIKINFKGGEMKKGTITTMEILTRADIKTFKTGDLKETVTFRARGLISTKKINDAQIGCWITI